MLEEIVRGLEDLNRLSKQGISALHYAVHKGRTDVLRLLLENGADLEACDYQGCTPLITAAKLGRFDALKKLVKMGADLDAKDNQRLSVDSYAQSNRRADIRTFLMEHRRKISLRGKGASITF